MKHSSAAPTPSAQETPGCVEDLIIDVGAHEGQDTEFYLKKGFRVVAVEAHPELAANLAQRFAKETAEGRFVLAPGAIAAEPGEIDFYVNDEKSIWSTANPAFAKRNEKAGAPSRVVKVKARRFEDIIAEHGVPYYLKIDIEGSDILCLEALKRFAARPRYVSMESEKLSWQGLRREFDLFEELGYRRFQLVSQGTVIYQTPPEPAREGVFVPHAFPHGASGLFGRELSDDWLDRGQAIKRYQKIFVRYRLFGHNTVGEWILQRLDKVVPKSIQYRLYPSWWDTHAAL